MDGKPAADTDWIKSTVQGSHYEADEAEMRQMRQTRQKIEADETETR
jgi:hypothetical protein